MLVFHMLGAIAEFERALIRERTMAGSLKPSARASGEGGRAAYLKRMHQQPRLCWLTACSQPRKWRRGSA